MKKGNINAICIIYLKYPFSESLTKLIRVNNNNNFGFKLIKSSTKSNKVKISIPAKIFKKLLGENPKEGKVYPATENIKKSISRIEVKELKVDNN